MARPIRGDFPGAGHHVMHRAARRRAIFRVDADHVPFLDLLDETERRFAVSDAALQAKLSIVMD